MKVTGNGFCMSDSVLVAQTGHIIAAFMQVHSTVSNGYQELIYHCALEIEMPLYLLAF